METTMNGREQRGLVLAATARITRKGDAWSVPSQTLNGRYTVTQDGADFRCSCPDHETRGIKCKHAFAVEFVMRREIAPDGTVTETRAVRLIYSQDWPAYNRAQTQEKDTFCGLLRDLVSDVPPPERKRGRPALPPADMLFSAAFKVYSTVSARRFMTDLRAAGRDGFIGRVPHYNSIFNFLDDEHLTARFRDSSRGARCHCGRSKLASRWTRPASGRRTSIGTTRRNTATRRSGAPT